MMKQRSRNSSTGWLARLGRRRTPPQHVQSPELLCDEHGAPLKHDAYGNVIGLCPLCNAIDRSSSRRRPRLRR